MNFSPNDALVQRERGAERLCDENSLTKRYLELGCALLLFDRMQSQDPVMSLIERCRPLNGEFRVSTEIEFASASEMLAYLFEHRKAEGYLDWSCDSGFIALEFDSDGSLVIIWSSQDIALDTAINTIEETLYRFPKLQKPDV